MLIKERININAIESRTSHADAHLSDTLNRSTQESSHVVNERLTIWNAKKARQSVTKYVYIISIIIAINCSIIRIRIINIGNNYYMPFNLKHNLVQ